MFNDAEQDTRNLYPASVPSGRTERGTGHSPGVHPTVVKALGQEKAGDMIEEVSTDDAADLLTGLTLNTRASCSVNCRPRTRRMSGDSSPTTPNAPAGA